MHLLAAGGLCKNQDAVFPSRIFGAISSLLVHLVPILNGSAPNQQAISLSINGQAVVSVPALPTQVVTSPPSEPVGNPTECLLLKNMCDIATEIDPDFDLDIKKEVQVNTSGYHFTIRNVPRSGDITTM